MSDRKITFEIITPERTVYSNTVDEVIVPTLQGDVSVMSRHTGMVALVSSGAVRVRHDGEEVILHVYKGILGVKPGSVVTILADSADHINELDEAVIVAAKERVEKILAEKDTLSAVEFARFEDSLAREIGRLRILEKYR